MKSTHQSTQENDKFECAKCDKKFHQATSLKEHIKSTHDSKRIKCQLCERKFNKVETFKTHMIQNHDPKTQSILTWQKKKLRSDNM